MIQLDVDELRNPEVRISDLKITDLIYLRLNGPYKLDINTIAKWIGLGIKDVAGKIHLLVKEPVCLDLISLDFNYTDFQEEALYCAIQGWISEYYQIEVPSVRVDYNPKANKYEFEIPNVNK